jgi:hypothetical protein
MDRERRQLARRAGDRPSLVVVSQADCLTLIRGCCPPFVDSLSGFCAQEADLRAPKEQIVKTVQGALVSQADIF